MRAQTISQFARAAMAQRHPWIVPAELVGLVVPNPQALQPHLARPIPLRRVARMPLGNRIPKSVQNRQVDPTGRAAVTAKLAVPVEIGLTLLRCRPTQIVLKKRNVRRKLIARKSRNAHRDRKRRRSQAAPSLPRGPKRQTAPSAPNAPLKPLRPLRPNTRSAPRRRIARNLLREATLRRNVLPRQQSARTLSGLPQHRPRKSQRRRALRQRLLQRQVARLTPKRAGRKRKTTSLLGGVIRRLHTLLESVEAIHRRFEVADEGHISALSRHFQAS